MKPLNSILCLLMLMANGWVSAQEPESANAHSPPVSLSQLAAMADVIVLAQARDTDYIYRREFPVKGSAYLKVLIPYKVDQAVDIIEIYEEGLHSNECYFPNPTVFEEGRRYLLFLKKDPDDAERYRGLDPGCALDVLVADDNRYALRMPITGMNVSDDLESYIQEFSFSDSYATESDESLNSTDRDARLDAGWLEPLGDGYIYTQGIDLTVVRQLLGEEGVSLDRHQKRVRQESDTP